MLALIALMFLISATHWMLQIITTDSGALFLEHSIAIDLASPALGTANIVLSDAIVLWRMCLLWNNSAAILAIAAALWLPVVGLGVANYVEVVQGAEGLHRAVQVALRVDSIGSATLALSLGLNLIATLITSWKVWLHNREIRRFVSPGARQTFVERFMVLLVKSGMLYVVFWILLIVSAESHAMDIHMSVPVISDTGNGLEYQVLSVENQAFEVLNRLLLQATGIYPTIIIVLVTLQKTHCDRQFTYDYELSEPTFATNAARSTYVSSAKLTGRVSQGEVHASHPSPTHRYSSGSEVLEINDGQSG
ncbi:hypothetical protein K488DRAFT_87917 [Vararia minispora EC-137]|uniref:Uncharacterized protein n=1 Tax=Vararia minispora EC-137 TaxID=1314806 RepID=A0ACB8QEN5_9AGAM|nr:hypothetical protein K488DRAFT_87917 [Vararia minispora EC-137]